MRFIIQPFLLCFVIVSQAAFAEGGGSIGGGSFSYSNPSPKKTPKQIAIANYNKGLKYRDKAWKYEEKAANETDDRKKDKLLKRAQKQYTKAIKKFQTAIDKRPEFFQAHSSLGYALRKTGDYEASLTAYNKSLEINPVYPEAIEYRAEAYLQLNRFKDVKEAYNELSGNYPQKYADQLIKALLEWQKENTQTTSEAARDFLQWINQRKEIIENTASLEQSHPYNW